MTQGWCISGDVVVAPHQTTKRAIFYTSEPQVTYHSNSNDQGYWGYAYTSFNGAESFADGTYTIYRSDQASCQILQSYDCINGACVPSTTHGTLGLYASLSDCQVACGAHGCSGQCVSSLDWAQIEGLSNQLKNRNCG
ncbi:hypothetical protein [Nostoc sp. 'Lobaria pulmonaria (5183) cyanobiont']|uniref:hypothetical protein n=1 Tax=Nostoc sp. 'Lobaria pulmonaria (5183) cyanobiont' TaxID=1618022 RepID=UPI000CF326A4|nr:hypothetical protein [Nostoc sp. 'Lobaria pulmonaria (5183) cyanobiont']AVH71584.1 hypothetical protein NLP_2994 [Nostoc sp. 'Lobaria pulmonaria (5183) cyanobiont']